ncbi:MAG: EAL domain-containing protein, partial [Spirochaeta sp.]|nr:EAL domain-containing protein [Spirochaeta sp.]
ITSQIHTENELRRVNRELDQLLKARTSSLTTAHRELQLMNSVMQNSLNGVTITDDSGVIQQINAAFTAETGYAPDDAIGKTPRILKSGRHDETFYQKLWAKIQTTGTWEGEIWNRRKTGEVFPEWLAIQAIYDEMGQVTNYVAVFHDLTELRKKEEEVEFSTNYDALTRLPNRLSFLERVDAAIRNARRHETSVAVAIADIDDFRRINETGGHPAGDAVLEHLAGTLRETVGDDATVARIVGDEFGVLIDGIIDQWDYLQTTDRLAAVSEKPTTIAGTSYDLTLTIGVALFPGDGDTAMTLLNNAEAALYQVKRRPRLLEAGRVGMYTAALDEALRRRISIESQMRIDLENRRFVPFYQPRIDLATGRVVGAEALARWIREDGTVVSPGEFIPLAEETGLIVRLGEVMLDNVHRDLAGSLAPFRDDLTVSFNASIKELLDPGFVERLSHRIAEGGTANTLELELTESVIMDDIDNTMPVLETIKAQGLSLAVDDFGTGYSSLYYLKRLPIDVLKIDKSFVDDIASDGNDQAIVTTIIAMGKALNLRLVAEGIETPQQREFLTTHGCTEGQGYLYGKPMDRDTFVQFLETVRGAVP